MKQVEVGEILEPLYRSTGEWEKLAGVYEAQLAHTARSTEERLATYYRIAELPKRSSSIRSTTLDVYVRALKEFPLDEKTGEEAPRLAGAVDGGWETLANAYADVLGLHDGPDGPARDRASASRACSKTSSATSTRPRRRTTTSSASSRSTSRRSRTSIASTSRSSSGPSSRRSSSMRVKAHADALELVELYARLGEIYETRLGESPNAIRAFRQIFDELDKTHEGAIAALARIYEQQGAWQELDARLRARARERLGRRRRGGDPREDRASRGRQARPIPTRAIETWKVVLDLRGEDPEALAALANLYEAPAAVGASSSTSSSASSTSRRATTTA